MKNKPPTINELKGIIISTPVCVYDRVRVVDRGRSYSARGCYDRKSDTICISRSSHREWGGAYDAVLTVIHEALHKARPEWSERMVRQHELRYYKSRALRESAAFKLLNAAMFGNDWEKLPDE